jgi:hypothetical protein
MPSGRGSNHCLRKALIAIPPTDQHMKRSEITPQLERAAFEFNYWFARFEFCLKEAGFLKSDRPGKKAEPNWDMFVRSKRSAYVVSANAKALVKAAPQQQVMAGNTRLVWKDISFDANEFDLQKMAILLRVVRNNLFHGGPRGTSAWDDVDATVKRLDHAKIVLDELADLGGFKGDYLRG